MAIKKTLGGDRLGSGKKMQVDLKTFDRSTHDLGALWRSTVSPGTLVPFMAHIGLRGDTFDIDLNAVAKTYPTLGPIYGSFKLQLDVFSVPIRLYQARLHNNETGVGMKMDTVKLPQLRITANNLDIEEAENWSGTPLEYQQINQSSLLAYLGIRGLGRSATDETTVTREFNAIPYLAYWDIYKNYYTDKQQEVGYMISSTTRFPVETTDINGRNNGDDLYSLEQDAIGDWWVDEDTIALGLNHFNNGGETNQIEIRGSGYNNIYAQDVMLKIKHNNTGEERTISAVQAFKQVTKEDDTIIFYQLQDSADITIMQWQLIGVQKIQHSFSGINIHEFPLENLDEMRKDILADIKNPNAFKITDETYSPYGRPLRNVGDYKIASIYEQEGLALKTYQSDIFNNWLSTEWIDGPAGINAITSIDTSSGSFNVDTFALAKKVYMMLNDIAVSGGTYDDWQEAIWGQEGMRKAETPMYMGGLSREIVFDDVTSTASAEDGEQPLGTLAGKGMMDKDRRGGKIIIKIDEASYIIGIVSITPRIDYYQGNQWDVNLKTMNDLHKPQLDQIGFQDLITDKMAFWDTQINADESIIFKSAGKQPAWLDYMTNYNRVYGNFADRRKEGYMTIRREYSNNSYGDISDLTTYIDPAKFNYLFAFQDLSAMPFWLHIGMDITARRKMSAKIMPNV